MNPIKTILLIISLYSSSTLADYKPSISEELTRETITVKADGSNVSEYETITVIETEKGVDGDSQQDISYNSKTETVQIIEACLLYTSPSPRD